MSEKQTAISRTGDTVTAIVLLVLVTSMLGVPSRASAQPVQYVVWGWGANGGRPNGGAPQPQVISGLQSVTAVAGGDNYALFLQSDGTVWGLGANQNGKLGDGSETERSTLVQVAGLTGVIAVAAGQSASMALKADGTVWAWGFGALGDGRDQARHLVPVQVQNLTGVTAISAGHGDLFLALKNDGTVWMWNIGLVMFDLPSRIAIVKQQGPTPVVPIPMQVPELTNVKAISAGAGFGIALKQDGTVWTWGSNVHGQLGVDNRNTQDAPHPIQVPGVSGATAVSAGRGFSVALISDGTVWAWGLNSSGQLGDGTVINANSNRPSAQPVSGLSNVTSIAAGGDHSLALKSDGTVLAWGYGGFGEMGVFSNNFLAYRPFAAQVAGLPGGVTSIWAGSAAAQSFAIAPLEAGQPAVPVPEQPAVPAPASSGTTTGTAPAEAPVPDGSPAPDMLNDQMRADILAAVDRANAAWAYATGTLDTSALAADVAGDLLSVDLANVAALRTRGQTSKSVNTAFAVDDVTLDAPGHAVVHTTETWYEDSYNAANNRFIVRSKPKTYSETYVVEYVNGGWIATRNDLVEVN